VYNKTYVISKHHFFLNGGCTPTSASFITLFTKVLYNEYKDQSEATILATHIKPTRLMKGVIKNRANCPGNAPMHLIVTPKASPSRPTASREHQPVQQTLSVPPHTLRSCRLHLPWTHLQNRDPCIKVVGPAIDATTAPDSATSLRSTIFMCPPPSPSYATPSGPTAIDAVEEHRSTTETIH
jgi:hypothetical protein